MKKDRLLRGESSDKEDPTQAIFEAEYNFLLNQMKNPQVGSIEGKDKILNEKKKRQLEREERKQKLVEKETKRAHLTETAEPSQSLSSDDDVPSLPSTSNEDADYIPPRRVRKPKKLDKVMLELPTKDLMKMTADLCARIKLSDREATSLYAKIVLSGGGDLNQFVISKSTTQRHRILSEKKAEEKLSLKFQDISREHPYGILHWDGKKVDFESGASEEHLVICYQHVGSDKQPQFIGAPQTPNGTGAAQAEAIVRYIDSCGVEDQIIGHVWDTTASNSGRNIGAAKLLDDALGRACLWLACRRHAAERHCVHANGIVCGETKSPEEKLFKHFKKNFHLIDTRDIQQFKWEGDQDSLVGPFKLSTELALSVKTWAENCCVNGSFPREDYWELLELVTHVLGGVIRRQSMINKDKPPRVVGFQMEQPGAFHHARFMAKAIYYVKMYMVLHQLNGNGLVTADQAAQVERMSRYIILLYARYFLQTALTSAAPSLDLTFCSVVDLQISQAVEESIHRQMFYLTEELVVLALCDKHTTAVEKEMIVKALLQADRPQEFPPMKPLFKVNLLMNKAHDEPSLHDFIGPRSWLIFDLLKVKVQWMQYLVNQWDTQEEQLSNLKIKT